MAFLRSFDVREYARAGVLLVHGNNVCCQMMPAGGIERCPFAHGDFGTSRPKGSYQECTTPLDRKERAEKALFPTARRI
jgi:hypothetical protein